MIHIVISDDALEDLEEGFWFYESQQLGLGDYFASCLRGDIEGLKLTGGVHRIVHENHHRAFSRVFPYAIYYTSDQNKVIIWAVTDCRRDPEWIEKHLNR